MENLGDGDADKGLEKLKKELEDGEILGAYLSKNAADNEVNKVDKARNDFLDYIEEVRTEGSADNGKDVE